MSDDVSRRLHFGLYSANCTTDNLSYSDVPYMYIMDLSVLYFCILEYGNNYIVDLD